MCVKDLCFEKINQRNRTKMVESDNNSIKMTNEFNKINNYTFNSLGQLLFEIVPEYKSIFDRSIHKDEIIIGNYLFMNDFAEKLAEKMKENALSSFISNSFRYINEIGESTNLEILNILRVGILEILYTSGISVRQKTDKLLSYKTRLIFQELSKFYSE